MGVAPQKAFFIYMSIVKSSVVTLPSKIYKSNLSLAAMGLISYLLSFSDEIELSNEDVHIKFGIDKTTLHLLMLELAEINLKYITIEKNAEGYNYTVNENEVYKHVPTEAKKIVFTSSIKNCGVYILHSKYGYKVGYSTSISTRTRMFGVALPFKFTIHSVIYCNEGFELEKAIHLIFQHKRLNGEWFKLTKVDFKELDQFLTAYNLKREVNNG